MAEFSHIFVDFDEVLIKLKMLHIETILVF